MLGSHIYIKDELARSKNDLAPLPFVGAVYRVGHSDNHSGASDLIKLAFLNLRVIRNPIELFKRIINIKRMSKSIKCEFFGNE